MAYLEEQPQEFQGQASLGFHNFSPDRLADRADFEKQSGGERVGLFSAIFSSEPICQPGRLPGRNRTLP